MSKILISFLMLGMISGCKPRKTSSSLTSADRQKCDDYSVESLVISEATPETGHSVIAAPFTDITIFNSWYEMVGLSHPDLLPKKSSLVYFAYGKDIGAAYFDYNDTYIITKKGKPILWKKLGLDKRENDPGFYSVSIDMDVFQNKIVLQTFSEVRVTEVGRLLSESEGYIAYLKDLEKPGQIGTRTLPSGNQQQPNEYYKRAEDSYFFALLQAPPVPERAMKRNIAIIPKASDQVNATETMTLMQVKSETIDNSGVQLLEVNTPAKHFLMPLRIDIDPLAPAGEQVGARLDEKIVAFANTTPVISETERITKMEPPPKLYGKAAWEFPASGREVVVQHGKTDFSSVQTVMTKGCSKAIAGMSDITCYRKIYQKIGAMTGDGNTTLLYSESEKTNPTIYFGESLMAMNSKFRDLIAFADIFNDETKGSPTSTVYILRDMVSDQDQQQNLTYKISTKIPVKGAVNHLSFRDRTIGGRKVGVLSIGVKEGTKYRHFEVRTDLFSSPFAEMRIHGQGIGGAGWKSELINRSNPLLQSNDKSQAATAAKAITAKDNHAVTGIQFYSKCGFLTAGADGKVFSTDLRTMTNGSDAGQAREIAKHSSRIVQLLSVENDLSPNNGFRGMAQGKFLAVSEKGGVELLSPVQVEPNLQFNFGNYWNFFEGKTPGTLMHGTLSENGETLYLAYNEGTDKSKLTSKIAQIPWAAINNQYTLPDAGRGSPLTMVGASVVTRMLKFDESRLAFTTNYWVSQSSQNSQAEAAYSRNVITNFDLNEKSSEAALKNIRYLTINESSAGTPITDSVTTYVKGDSGKLFWHFATVGGQIVTHLVNRKVGNSVNQIKVELSRSPAPIYSIARVIAPKDFFQNSDLFAQGSAEQSGLEALAVGTTNGGIYVLPNNIEFEKIKKEDFMSRYKAFHIPNSAASGGVTVTSVAASSGGDILGAGTSDGKVYLWWMGNTLRLDRIQ